MKSGTAIGLGIGLGLAVAAVGAYVWARRRGACRDCISSTWGCRYENVPDDACDDCAMEAMNRSRQCAEMYVAAIQSSGKSEEIAQRRAALESFTQQLLRIQRTTGYNVPLDTAAVLGIERETGTPAGYGLYAGHHN